MIRVPETRAHRRAADAVRLYRDSAGVLGRSRHADALAGHLEAMVAENQRLRADLLASREEVVHYEGRWSALKVYIGGAG